MPTFVGLGTSSAFTVGLLNLVNYFKYGKKMDRRVSIEKHFEQKNFSNELSEEREYKKYGMYFYKINSSEDLGVGDYASGNSFFELLATFFGVENIANSGI